MPSLLEYTKEAQIIRSADKALCTGKLLGTIKLPKDLKTLSDRLPQPNYDSKPFQRYNENKV